MKRISAMLMNAALLAALSFGVVATASADCKGGKCPRSSQCCEKADCCKDGQCKKAGECCKSGECKSDCCKKQ